MKIAILTSPSQWFIPYAKVLNSKINNSVLYFNHKDITVNYDILFVLSYHKIIKKNYLTKNKHNIVTHASDLPKGKGWAPLFWQVLENKTLYLLLCLKLLMESMMVIYMQKDLILIGYELNLELREKQAQYTIDMYLKFLVNKEFLGKF